MMNEAKWFSKEIDAGRFYTVIEDLFKQGTPFVLAKMQIITNGMFWSLLLYKIIFVAIIFVPNWDKNILQIRSRKDVITMTQMHTGRIVLKQQCLY